MNVNSITAICAIVIAVASLAISIADARATRTHNRKSVRPILKLVSVNKHSDSRTGLKLVNVGLGPAVIVDTRVKLDGVPVGKWDSDAFNAIVGLNKPRPHFSTLYKDSVLPAGAEQYLIFIDPYHEKRHSWLWRLVVSRLSIEINYESIYGGEHFTESRERWLPEK